jgi:hypothetical protein
MDATFDISSGRNRYEPCPQCNAAHGMGLITRRRQLAVECDCGHRGPELECPPLAQWATWPVPSGERDRLAFEGWNTAARATDGAA